MDDKFYDIYKQSPQSSAYEQPLDRFNNPYDIYNSLTPDKKKRMHNQPYSRDNTSVDRLLRNYGKIDLEDQLDLTALGAGEVEALQKRLNQVTGIFDNNEVDIPPGYPGSSFFHRFNMPGPFEKAPYFTMEGALPAPVLTELEKLNQYYNNNKLPLPVDRYKKIRR